MNPDYILVLKYTDNIEDIVALTLKSNSNFEEISKYVNGIREAVDELENNPNQGLNLEQVQQVITESRIPKIIDGSNHVNVGTVTYDQGLPTEYTVTYSVIDVDTHQYVVSNSYDTGNSFVTFKNQDNEIEYPNMITDGTNVIITLKYKIQANESKKLIIF